MLTVLVCGGRNYGDARTLSAVLDRAYAVNPFGRLIHGAANGADVLAGRWAQTRGVPVTEFPADWTRDGRAAGPLRNQRMLDEGKPHLVIAFPGGRGTADMVARARKAGVSAVEAPPA